jgi:signal transduction histidine kinase
LDAKFGFDRSAWLLAVFVLLGVLLPTACVLWFMNEAATSQAESARQSVAEAYRGQLRMIRDRVEALWRGRAAALQAGPGEWAATDFTRRMAASGADSIILLDGSGAVRYPYSPGAPVADPVLTRKEFQEAVALERLRDRPGEAAAAYAALADSERDSRLAALAAQAQIRCLLQAGDKAAALAAIERHFDRPRPLPAKDALGRLIAADEQLLAFQLGKQEAATRRLAGWLNDYTIPMPSMQRIFLMGELRAAAPEAGAFPTFSAERLAARFLESEPLRPAGAGLERWRAGDPWRLTAPDGRSIALYTGASVEAALASVIAGPSQEGSATFAVTPPGGASAADAIAAGPMMPGWQVSFSLPNGQPFDRAASRRRAAFLWAGYLAVAVIALAGLLVVRSLRRQARLARLKTDLVAAVSHELKTPLASIRLLLETLLEDGFKDDKTAREYLEMIAGENLRLSRLIENFLTFSRMERNRGRFDFAGTTAEEVIQPAVLAMRERFRNAGSAVEVEISPDLPRLWADRDALVTVLLNLLDNACKYTPGEKRISVRATAEGSHVVFAVSDNGIGIAPKEQKRIFRRFYQVDRRLARETGGCGLGLNIVEFIVRAHGGEVTVESCLGAGSTFRVVLPCEARAGRAGA